ncbi:MAG: phospholipid carrier-dependent glycosyltransferase, partial [Sphingobacteriales bacterium]
GIKLMYDIALYYYNRNTAFIAAFLFTIQGTIIDLAAGRWATDHIDTAFLFFTLASIWFTIRYLKSDKTGNNIAAGLMMGCAIFTKWLPALIILPVWVLLIADAQKTIKLKTLIQLVVFLVSATVVVLPWQLYIRRYFPAEAAIEFGHMGRHFT